MLSGNHLYQFLLRHISRREGYSSTSWNCFPDFWSNIWRIGSGRADTESKDHHCLGKDAA